MSRHGSGERRLKARGKKRVRGQVVLPYVVKFACFRSRLARIAKLPRIYSYPVYSCNTSSSRSRAISRGAISHRRENSRQLYIAKSARDLPRKLENITPTTYSEGRTYSSPMLPFLELARRISVRFARATRRKESNCLLRFAPDAPE